MTRILMNLIVVLCVAALPACGNSPTGPSDGRPFDPNKPITPDNLPPGPGPSVKAQFSHAVYGYDCSVAPDSCDEAKRLEPSGDRIEDRETYEVKFGFSHTVVMCVVHPGVEAVKLAPGYAREISLLALAGAHAPIGRDFFYEGDFSNRGTAVSGGYRKCVSSVLFNDNLSNKSGLIRGHEDGGDLIFSEGTEISLPLAFRVVLARRQS